jgi:general secretion pathway protein C
LVLLASSAYFQAFAVTRLIGSAIGSPPAPARAAAKSPERPPRANAALLRERNVFDSITGPLVERTVAPNKDAESDPLAAPLCERLELYIVSESDDQRTSVATLRGAGELQARMRRVGDEVDERRVEYIGFNPRQQTPAVWLSSGHALCQAMLFGRTSREHAQHAQHHESSSTKATDAPERLRIVPELAAGKLLGIRLFGIQPKGAFAAIGLKNGDRLESINGLAMNSPQNALQLYSTLRSTSDFELRIVHAGERRPIAITLHLK